MRLGSLNAVLILFCTITIDYFFIHKPRKSKLGLGLKNYSQLVSTKMKNKLSLTSFLDTTTTPSLDKQDLQHYNHAAPS